MGLEQSLCAATGTPAELLGISQQLTADRRELLRSYRASTVEPLANLVAAELSRVLETDVRLVFKTSTPADLVSRARAFGSLRKAGADHASSAAAVGMSDLRPEPPQQTGSAADG